MDLVSIIWGSKRISDTCFKRVKEHRNKEKYNFATNPMWQTAVKEAVMLAIAMVLLLQIVTL